VRQKHFLGVDIGNTQTVIGLLTPQKVIETWRMGTNTKKSCDELAPVIAFWLKGKNLELHEIEGTVISSVVPPANQLWSELAEHYFLCPFVDAHDIARKIVQVDYPRPHEIGTDRLVNTIAAFEKLKRPCIVVDFGTATTFDCVSETGQYLGGAIAPGVNMSIGALFSGTSKLPLIRLEKASVNPIGKSTEEAIRSGILYGFAGMTDRIITELQGQYGQSPATVATGGLAPTIFPLSKKLEKLVPDLTMKGLKICMEVAFDL